MFKQLIALVPVAITAAFVSPAVPSPGHDQCRCAHLQDGAFHRLDLWITAEDGLPLRSQWSFPPEAYVGVMGTIGLDVGITAGGVMAWGVLAPTAGPTRNTCRHLCGRERRGGRGRRRRCQPLVWRINRSIALQPLSVEGSVGVNLSLGVSSLTLALAQ